MTHNHDDQDDNVVPIKLTGGVVEVHEIGGGQVDRPDVAAKGLNAMTRAVESAGGQIVGPVMFKRPGDDLADEAILETLDFPVDPDEHLPD